MTSAPSGLLLLGTSHVGKSTCAEAVGRAVGWPVVSTDKLGRHPGRPWTGTPDPVIEFYLRMTDDAIHWFLLMHHENMRPVIQERLRALRAAGAGFVLEGAALRPEHLSGWEVGDALVACLYVEPQVLRERLLSASDHSRQDDRIKVAIDRFAERSLRENEALVQAAIGHGVRVVDVTDPNDADRLAGELASRLAST